MSLNLNKKIITGTLALAMAVTTMVGQFPIHADTVENLKGKVIVNQVDSRKIVNSDKKDRIKVQAPDYYTKEYQEFIKDNIKHSEEVLSNRMIPVMARSKKLSVPLIQQENGYYCGPASLQMVLKYKGKSYSQSKLAEYAGTTRKKGTYVYRMRDTLNDILGDKYVYVQLNDQAFGNGLLYSIDKGYPVICHVQTKTLKNYQGIDKGHYVVSIGYVAGFSGNYSVSNVRYNDPNHRKKYFREHEDTFKNMSDAIENNAGFFIRSK